MELEPPITNGSEGSGGYSVVGVRIAQGGVASGQGPTQEPKQPASQMHQQQIHQGPHMPLNYAHPTPPNRQNYFPPPRGAPPRLPRPMVTMSVQNMSYLPTSPMYASPTPPQVMSNMPLMFNQGCVPLQLTPSGRHQNHASSASGFYLSQPTQSPIVLGAYNNYYVQQQPMRNASYQPTPTQAAPAQQPPPQQQPQVLPTIGGGGAGVGSTGGGRTKRKHAMKIVDPITGRDVLEEMLTVEEVTNQSGESSQSHTPQPQQSGGSGVQDAAMVADFAARVAAAASSAEISNGPHEVTPEPVIVVAPAPPEPVAKPVKLAPPTGPPVISVSGKGLRTKTKRSKIKRHIDKEGSEMDAFVEPAGAPVPQEVAPPVANAANISTSAAPTHTPVVMGPPAPVPQPPVVQEEEPPVRLPSPPPPAPAPSPPPATTVLREAEDVGPGYEEEEEVSESIMVAMKNEENMKPQPGAPDSTEVIQTQIIERSRQLKYKDGQWSPLNREGKKVYERDFLLDLRNDPLSSRKPNINSDCEIFVKDRDVSNNNSRRPHNPQFSNLNMSRGNNFVPDFLRNSSGQRGGGVNTLKRNSQSGPRAMNRNKSFHQTHSLKDEVKLKESDNAWRPTRCQPIDNLTEEEIKTQALYKKVRGILNRLTPQKFDTLVQQVQALPIDSYKRLQGVMDLVFEKAVDEPSFSKAYAEMCRILGKLQVPDQTPNEASQTPSGDANTPAVPQQQSGQPTKTGMVNFRKLLITRCQMEFEKNKAAELDAEKKLAEIEATKDHEKRKELQLLFEDQERRIRVKSVGLVRFIGELFKLTMLTPGIMHGCVKQLIGRIDEESLECLCKLLMTIGKELEKQSANKTYENDWNWYFDKMSKLSQKREGSKVSSRVRFMLQDVIELRANRWVPRRDENNPKTIEQIQKEAERETIENAALLASTPRKHENRDDRRRNPRGGGANEDGWQSVSGKGYSRAAYPFDQAGKHLQQIKNTEQENVLGSSNQFGRWGIGSGGNIKRDTTKSFTDNNAYAPLAQDDRKGPQIMNSRGPPSKVTPSPSLEKDRAIQGVKDVIMDRGKNPKGSSNNSSSGASSRESSRPRHQGNRGDGGREGGREPAPAAGSAPVHKVLPPEEMECMTKLVLEEYRADPNIEEALASLRETFPGDTATQMFVKTALNMVLDQSGPVRACAADLIAQLLMKAYIQPRVVISQFMCSFEEAEDLQIDLPHIFKYLAELIVPILAYEVFNFADFKAMIGECKLQHVSNVLAEIIKMLVKEKGPAWIRTLWEASDVQLKDFVEEDKLDNFIKENNCAFLFGQTEACTVNPSLSMDEIENKILKFLQAENDSRVFDNVCEWLTANLGEHTRDGNVIRALTKAVIRASIVEVPEGSKNMRLDEEVFLKLGNLIKRFVDTQEDLELACLYGIQNLVVVNLEAPKGLLQSICQLLYDNCIISCDAFVKWKERGTDEETPFESEGKGVAVTMLTTFFVSLSEIEDAEDDNS